VEGQELATAHRSEISMFYGAEENCAKGTNSQKPYLPQWFRFPFLL